MIDEVHHFTWTWYVKNEIFWSRSYGRLKFSSKDYFRAFKRFFGWLTFSFLWIVGEVSTVIRSVINDLKVESIQLVYGMSSLFYTSNTGRWNLSWNFKDFEAHPILWHESVIYMDRWKQCLHEFIKLFLCFKLLMRWKE